MSKVIFIKKTLHLFNIAIFLIVFVKNSWKNQPPLQEQMKSIRSKPSEVYFSYKD